MDSFSQSRSKIWLITTWTSQAVPHKGAILTQLSEFWFTILQSMIPTLRTHYISLGLPPAIEERLPPHMVIQCQLQQRCMIVKRLKVIPIESIVRGYITGSAWSSYQKDGTVCGVKLPIGLRESEKLQQPLWTPSTKAKSGENDENISPEKGALPHGVDHLNDNYEEPPLMAPCGSCRDRGRGTCRSDRSTLA